jgi:hypothetical protein
MRGWICVSCRSEYFGVEPRVRLRPVPEMGVCLAYTPRRPALHRLNAASWLIVSLCDGRSLAEVAAAYRAALGSEVGSEAALQHGIAELLGLGILRRLSPCSGAEAPAQTPRKEGSHDIPPD